MDLKALIFDMDGVIVDTEYQDFSIQKEFIKYLNPQSNYNDKDLLVLVGKSYLTLYKLLQQFIGQEYSIEKIEEEYAVFSDIRYSKLNYRELFREDIIKILDFSVENGIKLALASSSKYEHIIEVLESCGIRAYFDVIVSGENFIESKPNPEIYRATLNELSVQAEHCIAIEDSYSGIEASTSAGIATIGYYDSRLPLFNNKASWRVGSMQEVLNVIQSQYEFKNI